MNVSHTYYFLLDRRCLLVLADICTFLANGADVEHLAASLRVRVVSTDDFALAWEVGLRQVVEVQVLKQPNKNQREVNICRLQQSVNCKLGDGAAKPLSEQQLCGSWTVTHFVAPFWYSRV